MADKSAAPAAPAVASFDPVEWTRKIEGQSARINNLESDKQELQREIDILKGKLAQQTSVASSARGAMGPMKEEIQALRSQLASSENLKDLAQLRAEVARLHKTVAQKDKEAAQAAEAAAAKMADLTHRAGRAEAKFQALESTAAIMAKSRDKANEAATELLTQRDEAQKKVGELNEELAGMRAEFVKAKTDLDKAQAEVKLLRQAPVSKK